MWWLGRSVAKECGKDAVKRVKKMVLVLQMNLSRWSTADNVGAGETAGGVASIDEELTGLY